MSVGVVSERVRKSRIEVSRRLRRSFRSSVLQRERFRVRVAHKRSSSRFLDGRASRPTDEKPYLLRIFRANKGVNYNIMLFSNGELTRERRRNEFEREKARTRFRIGVGPPKRIEKGRGGASRHVNDRQFGRRDASTTRPIVKQTSICGFDRRIESDISHTDRRLPGN